jgi:hypothetical protein
VEITRGQFGNWRRMTGASCGHGQQLDQEPEACPDVGGWGERSGIMFVVTDEPRLREVEERDPAVVTDEHGVGRHRSVDDRCEFSRDRVARVLRSREGEEEPFCDVAADSEADAVSPLCAPLDQLS